MKGYLVFIGGEEFSPKSREMDLAWLKLIRQQHRPRLVVVPVAWTKNPSWMAHKAVSYFKHLGTFPESTPITNPLTANTGENYEILDKVEVICLTDGSPVDAVERLRDTRTHEALVRATQRRACVVGIAASAMALGSVYWFGGEWEPGLAIAPHLAIIPHHNLVQGRLSPERLISNLPDGVTILGIDDATAAICHPDGTISVAGYGEVMVYRSVDEQEVYEAGDTFSLPQFDSPDA
jgi:cyanophycinase-like exopeptidase